LQKAEDSRRGGEKWKKRVEFYRKKEEDAKRAKLSRAGYLVPAEMV
jgi:hypothetical protein